MPKLIWLYAVFMLFGCSSEKPISHENIVESRPNILLILLDDVGYSDLGPYGSEIDTPNINRLAKEGMLLTNFYAAPACSPSRAMLLTGNEAHEAGLGTMYEKLEPHQIGKPGYEGFLNQRVVSVASLLRDTGYHTYMSGKWHLGYEQDQGPAARGFLRSFALLNGGAGHFDQSGYRKAPFATYREDGQPVNLPEDFYSTDFFTDKLIEHLEEHPEGQPFFGYLAYTAPHWPLQAPKEDIDKYIDSYVAGYEALYQRRLQRMKSLGLVKKEQDESTHVLQAPEWQSLPDKDKARRTKEMAIYAAMIDRVDQNIGRLLNYLENQKQLDHTLIFLLSDNGAMGNPLRRSYHLNWINKADNSYENMGLKGSYISHHYSWARVSNAPFKGIKLHVNEGGIRVPALVWYPRQVTENARSHELLSIKDITPTILDFAGVGHPGSSYKDRQVLPMKGRSIKPLLTDEQSQIRNPSDAIVWEAWGERAIIKQEWKAMLAPKPYGDGAWQLFNLREDPGETEDLQKVHQEKLAELVKDWGDYAQEVGVVLK